MKKNISFLLLVMFFLSSCIETEQEEFPLVIITPELKDANLPSEIVDLVSPFQSTVCAEVEFVSDTSTKMLRIDLPKNNVLALKAQNAIGGFLGSAQTKESVEGQLKTVVIPSNFKEKSTLDVKKITDFLTNEGYEAKNVFVLAGKKFSGKVQYDKDTLAVFYKADDLKKALAEKLCAAKTEGNLGKYVVIYQLNTQDSTGFQPVVDDKKVDKKTEEVPVKPIVDGNNGTLKVTSIQHGLNLLAKKEYSNTGTARNIIRQMEKMIDASQKVIVLNKKGKQVNDDDETISEFFNARTTNPQHFTVESENNGLTVKQQ